mmetsp:Transcript_20803/g.58363  ORF Transcript_20803/g.58363 Transcript_20803/m.58363 type:complete len:447 (+) Transcript_20803:119-1459(+)
MGSTPNLWYVGVLLEILSTMSGTIGKQLIRLSELRRRKKNVACAKILFASGLFINTFVGPIVDMAAYSFAAQSLIAPFGGLDVVWNAMLAPYMLKETLTPRRVLGCALILLGTVTAGLCGNHEDSEYTIEYLEDTLVNWRVLIYFIAFFAWFLFNRLVLMPNPAGSAIRGISLGCTAGTIAGNMFCVKAAIELIQYSLHNTDTDGGDVWLHWLPYAMLAGAVFFALTNVIYMTKGLQEYEALFMVTVYEGSMIVSGCVSGAIVLMDLRGLEAWRIVLYTLGILVIIAGMYVIFSQELRSKSSLMDGTASIQVNEKTGVVLVVKPDPRESTPTPPPDTPNIMGRGIIVDVKKEAQARSFHANIAPVNSPGGTACQSPRFFHPVSPASSSARAAATLQESGSEALEPPDDEPDRIERHTPGPSSPEQGKADPNRQNRAGSFAKALIKL